MYGPVVETSLTDIQNKSTEHSSVFSIGLAAATIAIWMWVCCLFKCQIDLNCYYTLTAPQRNPLHVNQ